MRNSSKEARPPQPLAPAAAASTCNVRRCPQSVPAFVTSWGHSDCSTVKTTLAQSAAFQLMPVSRLASVEYLGSADRLPNTVTCELGGAGRGAVSPALGHTASKCELVGAGRRASSECCTRVQG